MEMMCQVFLLEENLGSPQHVNLSLWGQKALPERHSSAYGELVHFCQVQSIDSQTGRAPGSNSELRGLPKFGLRWPQSWGNSGRVERKLGRGLNHHLMTQPLPPSQPSGISAPLLQIPTW